MKLTRLYLIALFIFESFFSSAQSLEWLRTQDFSYYNYGYKISSDAVGNVYSGGTYTAYDPTDPVPRGFFVSKYNNAGNLLWTDTSGATYCPDFSGFSVGYDGSSHLLGNISTNRTVTLGGIVYSNIPAYWNAFLAKYNPYGTIVWVKQIVNCRSRAMTTDKFGNNYFMGDYYDTVNFGNSNILTGGGTFLVKYDSLGNSVWAKRTGSGPLSNVMTYGNDGNIYILNKLSSTYYIEKYDSNGNLLLSWNPGIPQGCKIGADKNGGLYLAGHFLYGITLGTTTLYDSTSSPYGAEFLAKVNAAGQYEWAIKVPSKSFLNICLDTAGTIFCASTYSITPTTFGITITKYDTTGTSLWNYSDATSTKGGPVYSDGAGNIYAAGTSLAGSLVLKVSDNQLTTNISPIKDQTGLSVYPNPTQGFFQISYSSDEKTKLQLNIFNSKGETVYSEGIPEFHGEYKKTIDLSTKSKGVYFIEIVADKKRIAKKIVLN